MTRQLSPQDASWFLDIANSNQLDLDPPYQRRSVWSRKDRLFFIDTILNNYPAPPVFLHKDIDDRGKTTYHVVDGKQRLQTLLDFLRDKIRVGEDFADTEVRKKKFSQLPREVKERVWNYIVVAEMIPDVSDAFIKDVFERINRNSRKLFPQEMRHARFDGWFISFAEAEAEQSDWQRFGISTPARAKRMADVQFVSELMSVVIDNAVEGFDQDRLDELYALYDDVEGNAQFSEGEFRQRFDAVKSYVRSMADADETVLNYTKQQANMYSLWAFVTTHREQMPGAPLFAQRYVAFMIRVDRLGEQLRAGAIPNSTGNDPALAYAVNVRGASTDITPRQARRDALEAELGGAILG
jgi:Protein of unknown function DUF262